MLPKQRLAVNWSQNYYIGRLFTYSLPASSVLLISTQQNNTKFIKFVKFLRMAEGGFTIESQFLLFSLFNCEKSDGTTITLRQIDKWFQQAEILDGKIVTHTDTGVLFNKFK